MSWSGFKKNVGRATTQVMMKTGHVEKTSDRSYDVEERRYRTLESASLRLQKEAKGYLDSLRAMTASQMRIAETIDAFYGDSGAKDGVSRSYKQAVEDLDAETVKALDGPYRCVPTSLYKFAGEDVNTIKEIEAEWNFKGGNRRFYTQRMMAGFEEQCELMDFIYRTTVLEPINRFCNYFPDINECIKKRNHKMLDYDSMRAKVKKLTEKPDKDPGKLPRTEKEAEMVGAQNFIHSNPYSSAHSTVGARTARKRSTSGTSRPASEEIDLSIPSPPKALQRPEIQKLKRAHAQMPARVSSMQFSHSPSMSTAPVFAETQLQRSPSIASTNTMVRRARISRPGEDRARSSTDNHRPYIPLMEAARVVSMPVSRSPTTNSLPPFNINRQEISPTQYRKDSMTSSRPAFGRHTGTPTPFFSPSELEELMAPLKQDFIQRQADIFVQAKAAYEQLNEQLTSELPQLIDLRVPYLDPSFEALVKIQLRFCAEAYSRMAQVQQYLDASTRDQYASGDLDARVEDVLGQIRELSIAGTV